MNTKQDGPPKVRTLRLDGRIYSVLVVAATNTLETLCVVRLAGVPMSSAVGKDEREAMYKALERILVK